MEKKFKADKTEYIIVCPACYGSGIGEKHADSFTLVLHEYKCYDCDGRGYLEVLRLHGEQEEKEYGK